MGFFDEPIVVISSKEPMRGVHYHKNRKRWISRAWDEGKQVHLGTFKTVYEANVALVEFGKLKELEAKRKFFSEIQIDLAE